MAIWKTDDSVSVEEIIATAAVSLAKFKVGMSHTFLIWRRLAVVNPDMGMLGWPVFPVAGLSSSPSISGRAARLPLV